MAMMKLGAHNSTAGGFAAAVAECQAIGGETLQIFCKNQRQWVAKPIEPEAAALWKSAVQKAGAGPAMVHDSYLINLGQPDGAKREAARKAFLDEMVRTEMLGIPYLNFHPGSHMAKERDDPAARKAALDRIAHEAARCLEELPGAKVKLV
ncbi:MAG: TIM barrel protein, partial [Thermoplasmatota archaeon]